MHSVIAAAASEPEASEPEASEQGSRPNLYVYVLYIYADEISIVSAYFGLPQCFRAGRLFLPNKQA